MSDYFIKRIADGGVSHPAGFQSVGIAGGLKRSGKPDVAIILSDRPAAAAGVLTTNKVRAACVDINRRKLQYGLAQAIVVNSGNANCFTGRQGFEDAEQICRIGGEALGLDESLVLGCSTGVIGELLPMDKVEMGIRMAAKELKHQDTSAARAIMTTDLVPKQIACEIETSAGKIRIGAIAKGSGMIEPNLATMFCFITTDAVIEGDRLQAMLRETVDCSFNCMTVDGDTSTNDMVLMLAGGASGIAVDTQLEPAFREALLLVAREMTRAIARDGEGATKLIEIQVTGAASDNDARKAAKTIANSPLVKTAMFGEDPNWGRIVAAAGRSGAEVNQDRLNLSICREAIVRNGEPVKLDESVRRFLLKGSEILIEIDLGSGDCSGVCWTCDLSYDYVKINAEYHT